MKNFILSTIAVLGFFIFTVIIAGVEQDTISVSQSIIGFGVGLFMMFLPCHLGGFMSYQEPSKIITKRKMRKKLVRSRSHTRSIA